MSGQAGLSRAWSLCPGDLVLVVYVCESRALRVGSCPHRGGPEAPGDALVMTTWRAPLAVPLGVAGGL